MCDSKVFRAGERMSWGSSYFTEGLRLNAESMVDRVIPPFDGEAGTHVGKVDNDDRVEPAGIKADCAVIDLADSRVGLVFVKT